MSLFMKIKKILQQNKPTTETEQSIILTDEGNMYVTKSDNTLLKVSDVLLQSDAEFETTTKSNGKLYVVGDGTDDRKLFVHDDGVTKQLNDSINKFRYTTDHITLTSIMISEQETMLSKSAAYPHMSKLIPTGGIEQVYDNDYVIEKDISGNYTILSWKSKPLSEILMTGDTISISYYY